MPIDLLGELGNPANPANSAKPQTGQGAANANRLLTAANPASKNPGGGGNLAAVSSGLAADDALPSAPLSGISKLSEQVKPDYVAHPERYEFPSFTIPTAAGVFSFQMAVPKGKYDAFAILEIFQRCFGSCTGKAISCPASGPAP